MKRDKKNIYQGKDAAVPALEPVESEEKAGED